MPSVVKREEEHSLRIARGGLPNKRNVMRAVFPGKIECGGIKRRVSRDGGHTSVQKKQLGISLSLWED